MMSASVRGNWWASLVHPGGVARGDILGGLTAAIVLLAVEGSYGLIAFGRLGPEQAQLGFVLGVITAALANVLILFSGGRGPLLTGSSAALALLVPALIATLAVDPRFVAADGRPMLPMLLSFTALGIVLAGLMQVLLAVLKLGGLVRYVPYPVHAGYMNGVAVLMVLAMLPHLIGLPAGQATVDWSDARPLAVVVAFVAFFLAAHPPRWARRIPAYLTALLMATALHHLLALTPYGSALGPLFEPPALALPAIDVLAPAFAHVGDRLLLDKMGLLLQFAAAAAFVSSLQTALAGSTVDELTRKRRNRGRELFAQGIANIGVGAIGGLPSAGAVGRSKLVLDVGGRTGMSKLFFGLGLVLALLVGLKYMRVVPMAAIAGVFSAVAYSLVDAWTRSATRVLWRQTVKRRVPRALVQSYGVMALVAAIAIFISLTVAIGVGMLVAVLLFIRSNLRQPIRQIVHADRYQSRKVRPADELELLRMHGKRIALVELDGALFFGTAEEVDHEIERLAHSTEYIVIDFQRVSEVDASGARVMLQAADTVLRAGKHLLFAGLSPHDGRTRMIRDMDVHGRLGDAQFFADADRALEHAEDLLLASVLCIAHEPPPLPLEDTLVGSGLDVDELGVLSSMLTERRFAKGEVIFRAGQPGDAMYVLLHGQIGIWLPESEASGERETHRLVSYAPGVVFGEMALMADAVRSADAIVERDALVLELTRERYQRLKSEHPVLLGKLLLNMSLLLASRVRALTDELRALQAVR
jgi:SulP family sulfate permease